MLAPHEAAKKIAAAFVDVRRAKEARLDNTTVQAAERRLAILFVRSWTSKTTPTSRRRIGARSQRFVMPYRTAVE
jgi:hypothetical protein